jgi:hypothetical protein
LARTQTSVRIGRHVTNRKARAAIEQAVLALQKRNEQKAAERASQQASRTADVAAIMEPISQLVKADRAATRAIARLSSTLQKDQKDRIRLSKKVRLSPGTTMPLSLILHEHIDFQFPPYDYEWNWGNAQKHSSDRGSGYFGVSGGSFPNSGVGVLAAGCGIGFVFNSDKPGSVAISPLVQHEWDYFTNAYGIGAWSNTKGGVDISAWQGSSMIAGVRRAQLFENSTGWAGEADDSGDGYAWPPDITLSFPIAASTWYAVSIGARLDCDHATGLGVSGATGRVQGYLRWVTVERWTQ